MGILLEWLENHKNISVDFIYFAEYLKITMIYADHYPIGRQQMIWKKQLDSVVDMDAFLIIVLDLMYDQVKKGVNA